MPIRLFAATLLCAWCALLPANVTAANAAGQQSVVTTFQWSSGAPALKAVRYPRTSTLFRLQVPAAGSWRTISTKRSSNTGVATFTGLQLRTYRVTAVHGPYGEPQQLADHWDDGWSRLAASAGSGVAVTGHGTGWTRSIGVPAGLTWSTYKVPLSVVALRHGGSHADVDRAILFSDNAAAHRLWRALGPQRVRLVNAELRAGGDHTSFMKEGHPGGTWMVNDDQSRYAATLPCRPGTSYVRGRMLAENLHYAYGIGTTKWRTGTAGKIGYGPHLGGLFMRHLAVVTAPDGRIWGVSMVTQGTGKAADEARLRQMSRWLANRLTYIPATGC